MPKFGKDKWQADGPVRALLEYLDELDFDMGRPSGSIIYKATGIAPSTVSQYFTGTRMITGGNLELLVDFLGGDTVKAEKLRRKAVTAWDSRPAPSSDSGEAVGTAAVTRELVGVLPSKADCLQRREAFQELVGMVSAAQTAVLSGLGGVGKTQLAAGLARQQWDVGDVDLLIWMSASTRGAIVTGYAAAAAVATGADAGDPETAAAGLVAWLTTSDRRWMIVLDDLADPGDLRGLWPPERPTGRTVVTTRRRDGVLSSGGRRLIDVGFFTSDEAVAYLRKRIGDDERLLVGADELATDLGYLPLAMAQATAYMRDRGLGCADYRQRLSDSRRRLADLVPEDGALPDDHRTTIAATWSLSIDWANRLKPAGLARPMLELTSVLDPSGIPTDVLTAPRARGYLALHRGDEELVDVEHARDALYCLRRLNLIDLDDHLASTVRVHSLVQRATREQVHDGWRDLCAAAADALVHAWPQVERDPAIGQALRSNTDTVREFGGDSLLSPTVHAVLFRSGDSLGEAGLVGAAVTYWHDMYSVTRRVLGADHPDTLATRGNLARWRGEAGDPGGAVAAFEELLADRLRVLGADHPYTLTTRGNLARWRGEAGDPGGAVAAFEELLADLLRVLGPDHPDTLTTRGNLARWRGEAGDPGGAATATEELLADRLRVLDPDHPDTLTTRGNLARWRGEAGDPGGAATATEELLADRLRVLGPDHPDTLGTRNNLAYWRGEAGDPAGGAPRSRSCSPTCCGCWAPTTPTLWAPGTTSPPGGVRRGTRAVRWPRPRSCSPTSCGCWAPTTPIP